MALASGIIVVVHHHLFPSTETKDLLLIIREIEELHAHPNANFS
jgi:hypothetical protein